MDRLISLQAAMDVAKEELDNGTFYDIPSKIESLPSAQPEPLTEEEMRLLKKLRSFHSGSYAKLLDKLVASAQPEPQWIPCSERLPEESGEYLCTLVGVHNTGLPSECGYEPPNNRGITSGWSTCESDGFKFLRDDEVLAWMPLPESYNGE